MDNKDTIPGLTRNESEAAAALTVFLLGMLALLCATVLGLHLLSGLPEVIVYGILFAVLVFGAVCGFALLKTDLPAPGGPPQLQFRNPTRRARRPTTTRSIQTLR